jgi:tRNA modification GTPase
MSILDDDTIVAIATAPGRGALATLRVSGRLAHEVCRAVLHPWPIHTRRATLCVVRDASTGRVVDQVIAVVYQAPSSYTGENLVELSGHGGALSSAALVACLLACGARQAHAGEFTQRAVLNGKLDLLQAESVADVIDANTEAMRRAALFQLDGGLSARIESLRSRVLELEALIAYDIDFPEEDDGPVPEVRISRALTNVSAEINQLLATSGFGEVVREGAIVVIAGRPNVGKSSLFNSLLGYRRAIVTDVPGTTRDALEALLEGDRWPIRLIDTAGLQQSDDLLEKEGIEVSRRYLHSAQLVLVCDDRSEDLPMSINVVRQMSPAPIIAVRTKSDVEATDSSLSIDSIHSVGGYATVRVSAVARTGLRELVEAVQQMLDLHVGAPAIDAPILTRTRHKAALNRARDEITAFESVWRAKELPAAVAAVHVRSAAHELEDLIGGVDIEDILDRVFSNFCIGK